jgi:hypothetical protein
MRYRIPLLRLYCCRSCRYSRSGSLFTLDSRSGRLLLSWPAVRARWTAARSPSAYSGHMADTQRSDQGHKGEWEGLSCLSWLWPQTVDSTQFEAKRAIANLTHGLRRSRASGSGEPDADAVLHYVAATNAMLKATEEILGEVVAEAIARGATWRQVGEQLHIGKTGAQKRFGKGVTPQRREILPMEKHALELAFLFLTDAIPEDLPRALDENDWEAAPPSVAVPYTIRNLAAAGLALEEVLQSEEFELAKLDVISEKIRQASVVLLDHRAVEAITAAAVESGFSHPWQDEAPMTYFIRAACLAFTGWVTFFDWVSSKDLAPRATLKTLVLMRGYLHQALMAIFRPECIMILNLMESQAERAGDAVFRVKPDPADGWMTSQADIQTFTDAFWAGDARKLSDLGVRGESNIDIYEMLRLIEDEEE